MTLEEKIAHLQATSMEEARLEGNSLISSYREAREKVFQAHKEEKTQQAEVRVKAEKVNARQQLNQETAKAQLDRKRRQGKVQQELKDKIFEEVSALVKDFMQTADYEAFLIKCIKHALAFAGSEPMIIYINASDERLKAHLEEVTGAALTVSVEDFIGGMRAVIRSRNVLIDNSFKTQLRYEYDKFLLVGGDGIA